MRKIKKIALMMGNNSFIGREYASNLITNNINFEILIFGKRLNNNIEKNRTKGFWKPLSQSKILKKRKFYYFDNVKSKKLLVHLKFKKYHLGIQGGGLGIINKKIIKSFKKGILNMHPGKLPNYRGSSAPELQIMDQKTIRASFHLINDKIDSGKLIYTKKLDLDYSSYEKMRSQIYPSMTKNLSSIINKILHNNFKSKSLVLYETKYSPKKFIGNKMINHLKLNWNKYTKNHATK